MSNSSINDFVNQIVDQDFSKANASFDDLLSDKMTDALEAEKVKIADAVFNGVEEEVEDEVEETEEVVEDEEDFTDEELDQGAEEAAEEE